MPNSIISGFTSRYYDAFLDPYFPAPLAPTTAIRDSRPTSMSTFFRTGLSGEYPKDTLESCSRGGEILSHSGNLWRDFV